MKEHPKLKSLQLWLAATFWAYRNNIFGLMTGIIFGFLMSHAGATTYDFHAKLFLLENFQLLKVIGTAVVVGIFGVFLLKQFKVKAFLSDEEVDFVKKPYQKGLITGALLFGIGWGMTASCPGTIPAMIGEGKVGAIFTLLGIIIGTTAFGVLQDAIHKNKNK